MDAWEASIKPAARLLSLAALTSSVTVAGLLEISCPLSTRHDLCALEDLAVVRRRSVNAAGTGGGVEKSKETPPDRSNRRQVTGALQKARARRAQTGLCRRTRAVE